MVQPYIKSISKDKSKNILVLGAGGFTLSLGDVKNKYTYIDFDKDLKDVSEKYFLNKEINGRFIADDARHYLIKNKEKYDAIVVDVFTNKTSIPAAFVTGDFYEDVEKSLNDDGVLFVNTISKPLFKSPLSRKLKHSIEKNFECHVSPVYHDLDRFQNIIYACSKKIDNEVYTDDKTNLFELAE
jgi:spermidine synthase